MSGETAYAEWIAVDWGTSNVRAWAMRDDQAVAEASSNKGMSSLAPDQFEAALLELIEPWMGLGQMPVVACGMVGARQGWIEAPYISVPCRPVGDQGVSPVAVDQRLEVTILPGLSQNDPADVMRGEETQIAGFLSQRPAFDGVICLPGTHTKWVHISAGEVVSFRTFMTGEMFNLMNGKSVLRYSMDEDWHEDSFAEAVRDSMGHPHMMASRFFTLRAESLLGAPVPGSARARLSGLLIGSELAAARPYWLGQKVIVLGEGTLAGLYALALDSEGVDTDVFDVSDVTLAGLKAAYHKLKDTP